jgi:2,4-diketo-3-deoxy-L-fuconate hydrolase
MKIANRCGRAALVLGEEMADVADASNGLFGPDPMSCYERWPEFVDFAARVRSGTAPLVEAELGCPVPTPRQVFAIGLNYRSHAEESGMAIPEVPATFTKFPASLAGPFDDVEITAAMVDWEVELVAVIGTGGHRIPEDHAWRHIAGLTVGQDLSERHVQMLGTPPQFSLAKSFPGFGPTGPVLVTPDEFTDPDDLQITGALNGATVQQARTKDMIFPIPELVARISAICPLLPGDLIFTGTPAGVGIARQPPRFLQPGQVLESWIEGIGTIRNHCTPPQH